METTKCKVATCIDDYMFEGVVSFGWEPLENKIYIDCASLVDEKWTHYYTRQQIEPTNDIYDRLYDYLFDEGCSYIAKHFMTKENKNA